MSLRSSFKYWRRKYRKTRSNRALRYFLIAKARLGRFDRRYFSYYGVSSHVVSGARRAATRAYAAGLVPTSTLRTPVGAGSYHNARDSHGRGKAIDFGLRRKEIGTANGLRKMIKFQRRELRRRRRGKLSRMIELIGPDNRAIVLRDSETDLGEGTALEQQHDNHVHEAYDG